MISVLLLVLMHAERKEDKTGRNMKRPVFKAALTAPSNGVLANQANEVVNNRTVSILSHF